MSQNLVGLVFGTMFGFMLCCLGFTQYDTIFNALLLQDFYLWKVFCSAVATANVSLLLLRNMGARTWLGRAPIEWSSAPVTRDQWIGGALFGVGWVVAGTCPGPTIARLGAGQWIGLFTMLGIFGGIYFCDALEDRRRG